MKILEKFIFNPAVVIIVTIVALSAIIGIRRQLDRVILSQQNLQSAQEEIAFWEKQVTEIDKNLTNADDPLSKEKIIRNELLKQTEGELIIKLADLQIPKKQITQEEPIEIWQEWVELLWR